MAYSGYRLFEVVDTTSPCTAGFGIQGNRKAVMQFILQHDSTTGYTPVTISDTALNNVLVDILDSTISGVASSDGHIQRNMPLAHPIWNWLYATQVSNITGMGENVLTTQDNILDVPCNPQFALYTSYKITVDFEPRSYTVMTNDLIDIIIIDAYNLAGVNHPITLATEWLRYTDYTISPSSESVTMQTGQMIFNSSSTANEAKYDAMPRLFLPDSVITYVWHGVPARLITSQNSYINSSLRGRVNQNAFPPDSPNTPNDIVHQFSAGSLLYVNYKPIFYTPISPGFNPVSGVYDVIDSKLCDIEFSFLYTNRQLPSGETPAIAPTNNNYIVGGHNLQPWAGDRRFHYAMTGKSEGTFVLPGGIPSFYSFPFELLFQDCDAPSIAGAYPFNS